MGGTDPLHCTALGKAHLAYFPFAEVRELMRIHGMPRVTEHTLNTISALKADLEETRARGYAIDDQESMLGGYCVAAPILNGTRASVSCNEHRRPIRTAEQGTRNYRFSGVA